MIAVPDHIKNTRIVQRGIRGGHRPLDVSL